MKIINHKSGLNIIFDYNESKLISLILRVDVGSINENSNQKGISHFIEHMVFNGSSKYTKEDILYRIPELGATQNAFTGFDDTSYSTTCMDTNYIKCLDVLFDMVINPSFPDSSIHKEKNVVIQEINDYAADVSDVSYQNFFFVMYETDEIKTPILGTKTSVNSFTRNDLIEYHKKYYRPSNMTLSVSGNFDVSRILDLVDQYFTNEEKINKSNQKFKINSGTHLFATKFTQCHYISAYEASNFDLLKLRFLSNIIGSGMSSMLFKKIREDMGLCYSISSYIMNVSNNYSFVIVSSTEEDNIDKINENIPLVLSEVSKIDKETLEKEKTKYIFKLLKSNSDITEIAEDNLDKYKESSNLDINEDIKMINMITLEEIHSMVDIFKDPVIMMTKNINN